MCERQIPGYSCPARRLSHRGRRDEPRSGRHGGRRSWNVLYASGRDISHLRECQGRGRAAPLHSVPRDRAHVLKLRSDHSTQPWTTVGLWSSGCVICSPSNCCCQTYCSSRRRRTPVSLAGIDALQFVWSFRYGDWLSLRGHGQRTLRVCALHEGRVVHISRSKPLRDGNAFIARQMELPERSASARVRAGSTAEEHEIDAADWFTDWERGGVLQEEARHLSRWDRTLTLIQFQGLDVPAATARGRQEYRWEVEGRDDTFPREPEDEFGLRELDGNLRRPGKSRRS